MSEQKERGNIVELFGRALTADDFDVQESPELQLRNAIERQGFSPPDQVYLDGEIHRFSIDGSYHDKSGWYVAFSDGIPAGTFGSWKEDEKHSWRADIGRELTAYESMKVASQLRQAAEIRKKARQVKQEAAAETCLHRWNDAQEAPSDHPYLQKKGVQPHGARMASDGKLMLPLYNKEGQISSLQHIAPDGTKKFQAGGKAGGCFWWLGDMQSNSKVFIAEGFATAASVHEATKHPVVITYNAKNMIPVTGAVRDLLPGASLVLVADNDESETGQKCAYEAAEKYGAEVIIPPDTGDANDYAQAGGDLGKLLDTRDMKSKRLNIIYGDEISDTYKPPDEIIEGLITADTISVLYGSSNSGKTFFALALAHAVATDTPFFGKKVDGGCVLYLATESPGSVRHRIQALKKHYNTKLDNIAVAQVPLNFHEGDTDAFNVTEVVREIEEKKGRPVRLIIGDTLARMSAGANENSGQDMGAVMKRFDLVKNSTGAAVLIIHHSGKDAAKGARGWSGLQAHVDTEIEVSEAEETRCAEITKQRELPTKGEQIYFTLEVIDMGITKFGSIATTCIAVHDSEAQKSNPKKGGSKKAKFLHIFQKAWMESGMETKNDTPYITRSAFADYLSHSMGYKERTIKNHLNPTYEGNLIGYLLRYSCVLPHGQGWILQDKTTVSSLMIVKNNSP